MTPQERQLIDALFDRLATLEGQRRDPDAERAIADGFNRAPNAAYPLVQTVLVQDEALKRANARIEELREAHARLDPAAEEAAGWALLITAATSANDAVTLAEADAGCKYLSKNLLKVLMKRMVKHPTKPRQQMGKALTNLWASPDRLFDTLDWEGTFFGEATKDQIVRQGVLNAVVGVAFDPYYGLDSQTVYGFDLNGRDAFRLGLYGPLESEELFEARDKWRVGVKMKQDESLLCTDSRNIIKGIIRAE